jgi:hypothetical protein
MARDEDLDDVREFKDGEHGNGRYAGTKGQYKGAGDKEQGVDGDVDIHAQGGIAARS